MERHLPARLVTGWISQQAFDLFAIVNIPSESLLFFPPAATLISIGFADLNRARLASGATKASPACPQFDEQTESRRSSSIFKGAAYIRPRSF